MILVLGEKVEEFFLSTGLRIQQKVLDICYTSILNYKWRSKLLKSLIKRAVMTKSSKKFLKHLKNDRSHQRWASLVTAFHQIEKNFPARDYKHNLHHSSQS